MSDTPRTDENEVEAIEGLGRCVGANFARELERENAALRAQLEHYKMLLDEARDHLSREIMEVNALRADKARLDWLEKHHLTLAAMKERWSEEIMLWWQVADGERSLSGHPLSSPRAAIDAARKKAKL